MKPQVPQNFRRPKQAKRLINLTQRARAMRAVALIAKRRASKTPVRFAQSGDFDD